MKTINYIFLFVSLSFFAQAQTIRRVNFTPGITGVNIYTTVQAAHDASVAGDIIYIEPTNTPLTNGGTVQINRRVTLISTGGDNLSLIPNSNFDKGIVYMFSITLNQGSEGSRITGLNVNNITINDANCIIERNNIEGITFNFQIIGNSTTVGRSATIRNNIIGGIFGIGNEDSYSYLGTSNNNTISNNIIKGSLNNLVSSNISRNVFYTTSNIFNNVDASTITANIFDARNAGSSFLVTNPNCQGTTTSNNLCTRYAGLPANNGNVNSVNAETVFKVVNPWTIAPFLDTNLELSPTSPALTVGPSSTPIGIYSGSLPYVPRLANIPIITDFSINGIGNVNSPLQINVKARSNN